MSTTSRSETAGTALSGFLTGLFMLAVAAGLVAGLLYVWPSSGAIAGAIVWFGLTEASALMIAGLAGALGAFIHAATSYASFTGNRTFRTTWVWWFMLRPLIGAVLGVISYFLLRSGMLGEGALGITVSPFGIAALAAICGLVSKQLVDKLRNVLDTALDSNGDAERADRL